MPSTQLSTRNITKVSVLPLHGDPLLNHKGTGRIEFDGPDVEALYCEPFTGVTPTVGEQYVITGFYCVEAPGREGPAFKYTLQCVSGSIVSRFARAGAKPRRAPEQHG